MSVLCLRIRWEFAGNMQIAFQIIMESNWKIVNAHGNNKHYIKFICPRLLSGSSWVLLLSQECTIDVSRQLTATVSGRAIALDTITGDRARGLPLRNEWIRLDSIGAYSIYSVAKTRTPTTRFKNDSKTIPKRFQNNSKTIPKRSQNDSKTIPKRSQNDPKTITKRPQTYPETIPKRPKTNPRRSQNYTKTIPKKPLER